MHSPRPWKFDSTGDVRTIADAKGNTIFTEPLSSSESGSWPVGDVTDDDFQLAAAAPDLLASLKEMVLVDDVAGLQAGVFQRALAAIKKAEGR